MSTRPAAGFELFAVTADQGIHAWGPTLAELFRQAARGLFSLLVSAETVGCRQWVPVEASADDLGALLVAWLNELLYLYETRGMVAGEFRIEWLEGTALRALVGGEPLEPGRHALLGGIKAATYHDLCVAQTAEGWEGRVVLDI